MSSLYLTKTPAALAIPEVVTLILLSLPRRDLQRTASFVCRLWYHLGRPILNQRDFYWLGRIPLTERHLLEALANVQTLPIINSTTTCYYVRPLEGGSWAQLQRQIRELRVKNPEDSFRELVVAGSLSLDLRTLEPVKMFFTSLLSFRVENTWMDVIPIEIILEGCPSLEHLELDSSFQSVPQLSDGEKVDPPGSAKRSSRLAKLQLPARALTTKLKRLRLTKVEVDLRLLEQLLAGCCSRSLLSGLVELKMKHVEVMLLKGSDSERIAGTSVDESQILDCIHRACPGLNSLHFSLFGKSLSQQDQLHLFKHFPAVNQWSLAHSDVLPSTLLSLQAYVNNVTSLELACSCGGLAPRTLHEYLCSSPQLQHLWIHNMIYPAEYMDLEAVAENKSGLYYPGSCHDASPLPVACNMGPLDSEEVWLHRRLWACRDLVTLQIRIGGLSGDSRTARNSRVMFAYISLVCPRLRSLSISRSMTNVQLEGGLCYLGAMEELESLILQASHFWIKHVSDIQWVQKSSASAAAAAAATKARKAKPSAANRSAMSKSISRSTTRSTLSSQSVLPFKKSKTRVSLESSKPNLLSRVVGKFLGRGSKDILNTGRRGEIITRTKTIASTEGSHGGKTSNRPADEGIIIQRLLGMCRPEGVSKFLRSTEKRKMRAEAREEDEDVGYCWPEMELFVMDAVKYSGISSQSFVTTMGQLRPEITFRAFS